MKNIILTFSLCLFLFSCSREHQKLKKITSKTSVIDSVILTDSSYVKLYLPYKKKLQEKINEKLSFTKVDIVRDNGVLQSTLGNFLADVCYEKANEIYAAKTGKRADFSFFNYGGIRAGISPGNITFENAFKLMPFDNTLVIAEMKGDKVEELLNYFVARNKANPISKQAQIEISKGKASLKINGKLLQKNKTYYVITSNYLQTGGDKMTFFENPVSLFQTDFLMRDAIIEGFRKYDTLHPILDKRVIVH